MDFWFWFDLYSKFRLWKTWFIEGFYLFLINYFCSIFYIYIVRIKKIFGVNFYKIPIEDASDDTIIVRSCNQFTDSIIYRAKIKGWQYSEIMINITHEVKIYFIYQGQNYTLIIYHTEPKYMFIRESDQEKSAVFDVLFDQIIFDLDF
jgi:hypothetical protein